MQQKQPVLDSEAVLSLGPYLPKDLLHHVLLPMFDLRQELVKCIQLMAVYEEDPDGIAKVVQLMELLMSTHKSNLWVNGCLDLNFEDGLLLKKAAHVGSIRALKFLKSKEANFEKNATSLTFAAVLSPHRDKMVPYCRNIAQRFSDGAQENIDIDFVLCACASVASLKRSQEVLEFLYKMDPSCIQQNISIFNFIPDNPSDFEFFKFLIRMGAKIHQHNVDDLVQKDLIDVLKWLIDNPISDEEPIDKVYRAAADCGKANIMQMCLARGIDCNKPENLLSIHFAFFKGHMECAHLAASHISLDNKNVKLVECIELNSLDVVKCLISAGADYRVLLHSQDTHVQAAISDEIRHYLVGLEE